MGQAVEVHSYTIEEYLEFEEKSEEKHEFHNGEIFAMAGGSIAHSIIKGNAFGELRSRLNKEGAKCKAHESDLKVYIERFNSFLYPDVGVVCGDLQIPDITKDSYTNPILIVEILSDSTAQYDRGIKFEKYRSLPSFKEYVLVNQDVPKVELFYQEDESLWRIQTVRGLDSTVYFRSINQEFSMADIYLDVVFPEVPQAGVEPAKSRV